MLVAPFIATFAVAVGLTTSDASVTIGDVENSDSSTCECATEMPLTPSPANGASLVDEGDAAGDIMNCLFTDISPVMTTDMAQ